MKKRKEIFYLTTHSTLSYGYMASEERKKERKEKKRKERLKKKKKKMGKKQ